MYVGFLPPRVGRDVLSAVAVQQQQRLGWLALPAGLVSAQGLWGKADLASGRCIFVIETRVPSYVCTYMPNLTTCHFFFPFATVWFPCPSAPTVVSATTGACASADSTPRPPDAAEISWRLVAGSKQREKGVQRPREGRGRGEVSKKHQLFPTAHGICCCCCWGYAYTLLLFPVSPSFLLPFLPR